jgi:signal recognition particle subunit SRP68
MTVSEEIVAERKTAAPSTEKILNRGFLLDYLAFNKLEHTVARTLRMAEDAEAAEGMTVTNVARLYDIAVQNLDAMSEISAGQEHAGFSKRVASRKCVFRGYRCSLLAAAHLAEGRVREALVLLDRSDELVGLAQADLSESAGQETPEDLAQLRALQERLRSERCRLRAGAFVLQNPDMAASTSGGPVATSETATMRDQLGSFEAGTQAARGVTPLTHFPPQFEAVPPKPLFFDLASSAIEFDIGAINNRAKLPEAESALGAVTGAVGAGIKNLFGWGGSSA